MPAPKPGFFRDLLSWLNPRNHKAFADATGRAATLQNKLNVVQRADARLPLTPTTVAGMPDNTVHQLIRNARNASRDPAAKAVGTNLEALNAELVNARRHLNPKPRDPQLIANLRAAKERQAAYHAKVLQENPNLKPLVEASKSTVDHELRRVKLEAARSRLTKQVEPLESEAKALADSLSRGRRNATGLALGGAGTLAALGISGHGSAPKVDTTEDGLPSEPTENATFKKLNLPTIKPETPVEAAKTVTEEPKPTNTEKAEPSGNLSMPTEDPGFKVNLKELASSIGNSNFVNNLLARFKGSSPEEKSTVPPTEPTLPTPPPTMKPPEALPPVVTSRPNVNPPQTPNKAIPWMIGGAGLGLGLGAYYLGQDDGARKKKKKGDEFAATLYQ